MRISFAVASALTLGVTACSSGSGAPAQAGDAGAESAVIGCSGDPRGQAYRPGMSQTGKGGVFKFELVSSDPVLASAGQTYTWTLQLSDAAGNPVSGASFPVLHPWMPLHMHGTSAVETTPSSSGRYALAPLYLYMAGLWEVDITAQANGMSDSTSFFFCLM